MNKWNKITLHCPGGENSTVLHRNWKRYGKRWGGRDRLLFDLILWMENINLHNEMVNFKQEKETHRSGSVAVFHLSIHTELNNRNTVQNLMNFQIGEDFEGRRGRRNGTIDKNNFWLAISFSTAEEQSPTTKTNQRNWEQSPPQYNGHTSLPRITLCTLVSV